MFSWCHNRLEITGKYVCLDVMQPWIAGTEKPLYRHAIRQAIKLFLAGCAGILKPVRAVEYAPYPMLTASGTGAQTSSNQAFQHFMGFEGQWNENVRLEANSLLILIFKQPELSEMKTYAIGS